MGEVDVESEGMQQMDSGAEPELLFFIEDCPTCPSKPNLGECPFMTGTPAWRNWYEHFGYELVRWSQALSYTIEMMGDKVKSIKWGALGLNGVETKKDPVTLTRITNVPVVNTDDAGITVAENCDIITYEGTGILINKGKGVVINVGSGIVINFSNRTCTNTGEGIMICFGKSILENSGAGYGIIKTCKGVMEEDRVTVNIAGGMVIKNVGHLLKLYAHKDPNCNDSDSSVREIGNFPGKKHIDLIASTDKHNTITEFEGDDLDSDSDGHGGMGFSDNDNSDDETGFNLSEISASHDNTYISDEVSNGTSLTNSAREEDSSDEEVHNENASSALGSDSVDGLSDIEADAPEDVLVNEPDEDVGLDLSVSGIDTDNVDDYNDEVSSLCNSCCSDVNSQEVGSDYDEDDFAAIVMTADEDAENFFQDMNDTLENEDYEAERNIEDDYSPDIKLGLGLETLLTNELKPADSLVNNLATNAITDDICVSDSANYDNEISYEDGMIEEDFKDSDSAKERKNEIKYEDESDTVVRK